MIEAPTAETKTVLAAKPSELSSRLTPLTITMTRSCRGSGNSREIPKNLTFRYKLHGGWGDPMSRGRVSVVVPLVRVHDAHLAGLMEQISEEADLIDTVFICRSSDRLSNLSHLQENINFLMVNIQSIFY